MLEIGQSVEAFDTVLSNLKEHYNVDDNKEIFHWLIVMHGSVKSIINEMNQTLLDMDRYIIEMKKSKE